LTEEVACTERGYVLSALGHLDVALDQHEELACEPSLPAEDRVGRELEILGSLCDAAELLLGQPLEERHLLEGVDLGVVAEQLHQAATASRWSRSSAIWIAFSAAPLRRLSPARKRTRPFGSVGSSRIRPTSTSSIPAAWPGEGKSTTRTLGAASSSARASSAESLDSVSSHTDSA